MSNENRGSRPTGRQPRRNTRQDRGQQARPEPGQKPTERPESSPPTPMDEWIDEGLVPATERAVRKSRSRSGAGGSRSNADRSSSNGANKRSRGTKVAVPDLTGKVGKERGHRLEGRVEEAAKAFAAQRYLDARRIIRPIAEEVPRSPEVRELYGLTLYRLGKWKAATVQLEAFSNLTGGSVEQHPVLADCYRALGQHDKVDSLWGELREASPSADLVTEGRIVAAGSLADRGELSAAVQMLSKGFKLPARYSEYHLARAYALADLYERSGDVPQARQLFNRLDALEPGYADVRRRMADLD